MRSYVIVLAMLAAAGRANAMGADRYRELIAWNNDGSAALVEQRIVQNVSLDRSRQYIIVAAGVKPIEIEISRIDHGSQSKDVETIDAAACAKALKRLGSALAANHFDGVATSADRCKDADRNVVHVTATVALDVERSWVALPQQRTPTVRERTSWAVVDKLYRDYQPFLPASDCGANNVHDTIDVANRSGKLVLVFSAQICNSPTRVEIHGFAPDGHGGYADAHALD
jgi:hypothetical protein